MQVTAKIGILFDLDGVLIDSENGYSEIWKKINKDFPTGIDNLEVIIKGCTLEKILSDYFPAKDMSEKVTKRLYDLEAQMHYDYKPGAKELLRQLSESGIPKVLVTSSNADKMRHLFNELPELEECFDHIITANLIKRSKPDPEGYLLGASKINLNAARCVVFEDSLQGVKAGRNAGAFVIGVAGTLPASTLQPYSDLVINSLTEINLNQLIERMLENEK
ncbi:MAG: HAD family phosphatase [Muribaculaceae bacterium]|nr:HAD family phosphatase [Muribaculaceae bacterium]